MSKIYKMDSRINLMNYFLCFYIVIILGVSSSTTGVSTNSEYDVSLNRIKRQNEQEGCELPNHPSNGNWTIVGKPLAPPGTNVGTDTLLIFTCDIKYRLSSSYKIIRCNNTEWTFEPPSCIPDTRVYTSNAFFLPDCGKINEPLIETDEYSKVGQYPWVVAIYHKMKHGTVFVCGGTILTKNLIVTAALCVRSLDENLETDYLKIAVGKYYSKYMDSRDSNAKYYDISRVNMHPEFKGVYGNMHANIAILTTKKPLVLSKYVQPICINNIENMPLESGMQGVVAGWGVTETEILTEKQKQVIMPYTDDLTCANLSVSNFIETYFTSDNFCAGYRNKTTGICRGNSGDGLVFRNNKDGRYYIHGIVSVTRRIQEGCGSDQMALFTRMADHLQFLEDVNRRE